MFGKDDGTFVGGFVMGVVLFVACSFTGWVGYQFGKAGFEVHIEKRPTMERIR